MGDCGKGGVKLRKNTQSIEKCGLALAAFIKSSPREFESYGFLELALSLGIMNVIHLKPS
ncbi:MAG: hypothetical protein DID90_2727554263 [Candidatus Nitrotoga sp. LAW]|nr:MAG: hypothetical protein DID90_2727554263 [Candidatus Nitrotoga sp. LAW]